MKSPGDLDQLPQHSTDFNKVVAIFHFPLVYLFVDQIIASHQQTSSYMLNALHSLKGKS